MRVAEPFDPAHLADVVGGQSGDRLRAPLDDAGFRRGYLRRLETADHDILEVTVMEFASPAGAGTAAGFVGFCRGRDASSFDVPGLRDGIGQACRDDVGRPVQEVDLSRGAVLYRIKYQPHGSAASTEEMVRVATKQAAASASGGR